MAHKSKMKCNRVTASDRAGKKKMIYKNGIRKGKWEVYDDHGKLTIRRYY